jgi:hypothetical protein
VVNQFQIRLLLAIFFETSDVVHKSNVTETIMHLRMANEEISQLLQNLSTSEIISNQDSHKLNNTLNIVQMQLSKINTLANNNNLFISNFTNA